MGTPWESGQSKRRLWQTQEGNGPAGAGAVPEDEDFVKDGPSLVLKFSYPLLPQCMLAVGSFTSFASALDKISCLLYWFPDMIKCADLLSIMGQALRQVLRTVSPHSLSPTLWAG